MCSRNSKEFGAQDNRAFLWRNVQTGKLSSSSALQPCVGFGLLRQGIGYIKHLRFHCSRYSHWSLLNEEGGSKFLRNVDSYLPNCKVLWLRSCVRLDYYAASSYVSEDSWPWKTGQLGCLETSVRNCRCSLGNNPAGQSSSTSRRKPEITQLSSLLKIFVWKPFKPFRALCFLCVPPGFKFKKSYILSTECIYVICTVSIIQWNYFHAHSWFQNLVILTPTCLWRWNRQCSETSAYKIGTPGNYPEESIQNSMHMAVQ